MPITRLALAGVLLLLAVDARAASFRQLTLRMPDGSDLLYAILVPDGYQQGEPRPLILALHPGGERMPYYGASYARSIVAPATVDLHAIIIAPDCPSKGWGDPASDRAVMALMEKVMKDYTVDRKRVLVTGFSMGGRGTWFFSSHHPDLFTAAIPMAAPAGNEPVDQLGKMPTYIIHSRQDQVVPFEPAEKNARELEAMGRPVKFEALSDLTHFSMGGYVPALRRAVAWVAERW